MKNARLIKIDGEIYDYLKKRKKKEGITIKNQIKEMMNKIRNSNDMEVKKKQTRRIIDAIEY